MIIIYILIAFAAGVGLCYLTLRPRFQQTVIYNKEIEEENQKLEEAFKTLSETANKAQIDFERLAQALKNKKNDYLEIETQIKVLEAKRDEIQISLEKAEQQAKISYDTYIEQQKILADEKLNTYYDQTSANFSKASIEAKEQAEQEYLKILEDEAINFQNQYIEHEQELNEIKAQIADLTAKSTAMIEAYKREAERQEKQEFYKIQISQLDLAEIEHLRKVIPYLRNSRPVCKIIWESYYRNATSDMIGRILGLGARTGIYKITHLETGQAYIGQASNVADRFKEHVKCGLGIDTPANKLYTAMQRYGVENFTFELLEECSRTQLNEREKYYIELYKTQEWGWNQTKGGSASK